jgi:hypothetical protein
MPGDSQLIDADGGRYGDARGSKLRYWIPTG